MGGVALALVPLPLRHRHTREVGGFSHLAVPGHDDLDVERDELVERLDPAVAVEGREVREDGEHARLEEVATEQDAIVDEHGLVVGGVRGPPRAKYRSDAPEVDLHLVAVGDVGLDELEAFELGRDTRGWAP